MNFGLTVIEGSMVPFVLFTVARFIDAAMTIAAPNPETKALFVYLGLTVLGYLYAQLGQFTSIVGSMIHISKIVAF